jgi:hypothetical protein
MAMSELSRLTAEPTPTPAAPAASASGAETQLMPDEAMVGMPTALEMAARERKAQQQQPSRLIPNRGRAMRTGRGGPPPYLRHPL